MSYLRFFLSCVLLAPAALADDLETSVAMMAKIGSCGSPTFSPDGQRLAFVSNLSGNRQVWTVATTGGWPTMVTALDDPVGFVTWSPDGQWLAFSVHPGGGMNAQVYLVRPDGTGLRRLTDGGKETNGLSGWSHDGKLLGWTSNRRDPRAIDAYIYDLGSSQSRLVAKNPGIGDLADISRDHQRAILERMENRSDNNLFLLDLAGGKETLLTPHQPPGSFGGGAFSPDGSTIYLTSNKDRDLVAFARVRLGPDGAPGPIEVIAGRDDAELEEFEVTEDGRTAALLWNVAGHSELAFLDLATRKPTAGPKLPVELAYSLTFSKDGRYLAMTASGATAPFDAWVFDRTASRFQQVTHSPHAGVNLDSLVRPELVRFTAHDGLPLSGWLYRPRGTSGPGPTVLSFHGGPEGQEQPDFDSTYQALLSRGIAVFAPNVRGSSGFGKKYVNLDNGALRFNAVKDIQSSVDYVAKAGVADPKRIGIMGGSYGGYMVMAGLTEFPDLFAAGADLFGIVNFETFFAHTEPWMATISKVEYGDPDAQLDLLRRLSPIHKVDRVRAPTIVLHGANDTNVPVVEAEQVVNSLQKRSIPVEYVLFPDEGHGFNKTPNRVRSGPLGHARPRSAVELAHFVLLPLVIPRTLPQSALEGAIYPREEVLGVLLRTDRLAVHRYPDRHGGGKRVGSADRVTLVFGPGAHGVPPASVGRDRLFQPGLQGAAGGPDGLDHLAVAQ
ncbi:MAG: S9 family peptidase [Acidobacteria bacterium]|nr:S9 family peptidase [Acidobacteriota bacterium]